MALVEAGADAVKVGIGPGSISTGLSAVCPQVERLKEITAMMAKKNFFMICVMRMVYKVGIVITFRTRNQPLAIAKHD